MLSDSALPDCMDGQTDNGYVGLTLPFRHGDQIRGRRFSVETSLINLTWPFVLCSGSWSWILLIIHGCAIGLPPRIRRNWLLSDDLSRKSSQIFVSFVVRHSQRVRKGLRCYQHLCHHLRRLTTYQSSTVLRQLYQRYRENLPPGTLLKLLH